MKCWFRWLAPSALLLQSCGEPLVAPELIVGNRVLGARVETATDAVRAWPALGEQATVRWLLAGPHGASELGWAWSACTADPVSRGLPRCDGAPFVRANSESASADEPRFEISVPSAERLRGATELAFYAAFCASGSPHVDEGDVAMATTRCPEAEEVPLLATLVIPISTAERTNANPSFETVELTFDDVTWSPTPEGEEASIDCGASDVPIPRVRADGASHRAALAIPIELSEPLSKTSAHSAERETLQLSHYVTGGDLERAYSAVNLDASPAEIEVVWRAPSGAEPGGSLENFYFILRDGRGGADWARRAVCVVP